MDSAILSLIIFGACVVLYIWNRLPISVTALLGLAAMLLFGIVPFSEGLRILGQLL